MFTFQVVLVVVLATIYFVMKCRWWVIKKLIGKDSVLANCRIEGCVRFARGTKNAQIWDSIFTISDGRVDPVVKEFTL